ncbi:MAG TPA: DUF5808 domain-containing protein [Ktedonobacterales bacterium]
MTDELLVLSIFALILIFVAVYALVQPSLSRRDLLFGVTVAPGTRETPTARRIILRYQALTVLVALMGIAALVAVYAWLPIEAALVVSSLALFGIILLCALPFLWAYFATRRLAHTQPDTQPAPLGERPAAELRPRRYGDYIPWIAEVLPIAIIAATAVYLALTYPSVPARFPSHFDVNGTPNGYSTKSVASYFTLIWTQLSLEVILTLLAVLVVGARSLPGEAETRFRRIWVRFLYVLKVGVLVLLGVIAVAIGNAAVTGTGPSVALIVLPIVLLLLVLGGSLILSLRTGQGGARLSPTAPATDRMSDRFWFLGSIYVNRSDPSVFVERRFGVGWTMNFGNPLAWLVMAVILGAAFASSAIAIIAAGR